MPRIRTPATRTPSGSAVTPPRPNLDRRLSSLPRGRGFGFRPLRQVRHDHKGIQERQHDLHAQRNGRHENGRALRLDKGGERTICTSHIERLNGTQRLFLKRLNRLTYCFSKKLENLEAAFAMYAVYYNWAWRTRKPGTSGKRRPTAAMMAGIADHIWTFDEIFDAVLNSATQG